MLHKVIVLSLVCYARFVTSQQTGGLTGTDQSLVGGLNFGGGTLTVNSASGMQTQTGLTGLDTSGAQTGMDFSGTQLGVDPTAGQTGFDQTPSDPTAQTGFDAAGNPTGFDQTAGTGGFDFSQGAGQSQQGFDQQGLFTVDPLGGFGTATESPLFGGDMFGGTGGTGASSNPVVGGAQLGGVNPVQAIEPLHNEVAIFATSKIGFEYTFNRIIDIQTQVVQGTLYHIKMAVTKTESTPQGMTDWVCDVQVHDIPWQSQRSLKEFHCVDNTSTTF